MTHGGSRRGAGAPRTGKKHRVTISLSVDAFGFISSEAKKRGMSVSAAAEAIIKQAMGKKKPKRQIVKFWIGSDPLQVDALSDPHNLIDIAAYIYSEWELWNGFEVNQSKDGNGFSVTMRALPETWEKAKRNYKVFSS